MTILEVLDDKRAQPYRDALRRHGWGWTMALLDEDIATYGALANHEGARRGLKAYKDAGKPLGRECKMPWWVGP